MKNNGIRVLLINFWIRVYTINYHTIVQLMEMVLKVLYKWESFMGINFDDYTSFDQ